MNQNTPLLFPLFCCFCYLHISNFSLLHFSSEPNNKHLHHFLMLCCEKHANKMKKPINCILCCVLFPYKHTCKNSISFFHSIHFFSFFSCYTLFLHLCTSHLVFCSFCWIKFHLPFYCVKTSVKTIIRKTYNKKKMKHKQ